MFHFELFQRIGGHCGNAAHVVGIARYLDVAVLAPRGAPAILGQIVLFAALCSVADNCQRMVDL